MNKIIDIRFNTNFPEKSQYEWRIIETKDGSDVETLVNNIRVEGCACYSHSRFIEGEGLKHHLRVDANDVQIVDNAGIKIAYIQ